MKLVKLSNPENKKKWTSDAIRVSLVQTAKIMLPGELCSIHPGEGGFEGPYTVAMSEVLARALLEDGYTDLYDTETDGADVAPISFRVTELDAQGRDINDEVRERVQSKRSTLRAAADIKDRQRTIPFIFNATPEIMLRMEDPVALNAAVQAVAKKIKACITNIERSNIHQLVDKTGQPIASWILFVVLGSAAQLATAVEWPRVKWIVWSPTCQPVRVRVGGELLKSLGREQCCFQETGRCDKATGGARCLSKDCAMRLITLPSSVPREDWRPERAEKRARQEEHRQANRVRMAVAQSSRTVRQCELFALGKCMKGYGSNRPCQRKHGDPSAVGCYFNEEGFPITGACTGGTLCPYNHSLPNALRMEQRDAMAREAASVLAQPEEDGEQPGEDAAMEEGEDAPAAP